MAANERTLMSRKLPVCPNKDTADPFLIRHRRSTRDAVSLCKDPGERGDVTPFPGPLHADGTAPKNPLMLIKQNHH
jgi:hypothetical protein